MASFTDAARPLIDGLYHAARAAGADDRAARKAVASLLARAVERFPSEGKDGAFKVWLFMSLREESRGTPWEFRLPEGDAVPDSAPVDLDIGAIDAAALREAAASLPGPQRLLLVLCDREGLGYHEAAGVLKAAPGAVAASLRLARRELRARLS